MWRQPAQPDQSPGRRCSAGLVAERSPACVWSRRTGNLDIYVVNADGSSLRRITYAKPMRDARPGWRRRTNLSTGTDNDETSDRRVWAATEALWLGKGAPLQHRLESTASECASAQLALPALEFGFLAKGVEKGMNLV
ncbi:MAG: hypothetical protein R3E79_09455 [Caldilineaceae bacterium]